MSNQKKTVKTKKKNPAVREKKDSILDILGISSEVSAACGLQSAPRINELGVLSNAPMPSFWGDAILMAPSSKRELDEMKLEDFNEADLNKLRLVSKLLKEPEYVPGKDARKSPDWWILPEILAGMPFKFRKQAVVKFDEGICVFGKVPVCMEVAEDGQKQNKLTRVSVAGPARPMGCPEPPPEGSEFILAWREGEVWNWNLEDFQYEWELVGRGLIQARVAQEYRKYCDFLIRQDKHGDSRLGKIASDILRLLESRQRIRIGVKLDDLGAGFYAGVLFARFFMYRGADKLYAEKFLFKKSPWPDIIEHALDRHGWTIKARDLLTAMGGSIDDSKAERNQLASKMDLKFQHWAHTPDIPIKDLTVFSKIVSECKGLHKSGDKLSIANRLHVQAQLKRVPGSRAGKSKSKK
jgi:hypothetical protein